MESVTPYVLAMLVLGYTLLTYWYTHLLSVVMWNNALGECFNVLCGVRQGGVLSPYLFAFYINDIIEDVRNSGFGIYIGSVFLGCILYADVSLEVALDYSTW